MIRSHFFSNHTIDLLLHQMIKTTTFIILFTPSSDHPHPYLTTAPPAPYTKEEKLITDISLYFCIQLEAAIPLLLSN